MNMTMNITKIGKFKQGSLTGAKLRDALTAAWAEIASDPDALAELGIDSATASPATFSVDEEGGFVGETILIGIFIHWAGEATWKGTGKIVAKVRARHGSDAIGEQVDDEGKPEQVDDEGKPEQVDDEGKPEQVDDEGKAE
jgi:hypothetical protein